MIGKLFILLTTLALLTVGVQAAPNSLNYELRSYSVGGSGEDAMSSAQYRAEATAGEQSSPELTGTLYNGQVGYYPTQQANVPAAPTVTNEGSDYYNKLLVQLDTGGNPSDTLFAIAVSDDNFATTSYIQSDHTVGGTLGIEDYQTYATWGGASGFYAIGLTPNATYYFKTKAMHGDFTETGYGPVGSAVTIDPYFTFDIDVASTDTDTEPPFTISFGDLSTAVTTATDKIWVDFATNGQAGGTVYLYDTNSGLTSSSTGSTITSATADLAVASSGYGLQVTSYTESGGGPLAPVSPYNGSDSNVGVLDSSIRSAVNSSAPTQGGRVAMVLKAKITNLTPSATDYEDTITVIGSASF